MAGARHHSQQSDQMLIERVDVGCEARDAAARKTLQHRVFQQSGRILGSNLLALSWRGWPASQPPSTAGA